MRRWLLGVLQVPERPQPPPGSGPTLTVFRASEKFFYLSVLRWGLKQAFALVGLLFSLAFFGGGFAFVGGFQRVRDALARVDTVHLGPLEVHADLLSLLSLFELGALLVFGVQLVLSGFLLRLAWELRWYMVSDESLRIREGLLRVNEQTMTVANIQNMSVRQGPVQRLLGIADLEVQTAGGGARGEGEQVSRRRDPHYGCFAGIENAEALRDRLRAALARHRDAGLGDPEDEHDPAHGEPSSGATAAPVAAAGNPEVAAAASAVLREARALRTALAGGG